MTNTKSQVQSSKSSITDKNPLICNDSAMQRIMNNYTRIGSENEEESDQDMSKRKTVPIFFLFNSY
jgi:hypothetical protein